MAGPEGLFFDDIGGSKMSIENSVDHAIMGMERLLKPVEVAGILNISRSFAYQLLKSGEVPVVRFGRSCRVRPKDLQAYIDKNILFSINKSD